MASNVTGQNSTTDLLLLVSNLQNTINSVSGSITNINNNINLLNAYDTQNTQKINEINNVDLNQQEDIENLENVDVQTNNKIDILMSKFPITNVSINDNSISQYKIAGLVSDLNDLSLRITDNSNNLVLLENREAQHYSTLTTNLNNLTTKQETDHNLVYNELHDLLSSTVGDTNTFQTQIDAITTDLTAEKIKTTSNTNNITSNTNAINLNNSKIATLEADNVVNKQNILSNTTSINNNTTSINTITTNLNNLTNSVNTLSYTETTNHLNQQNAINTLTTNLSNLDTREITHYNDLNTRLTNLQTSNATDLTALENQLDLLDTREATDYTNLNTKIDNQITKQQTDHNNVSSSITVLQNDLSVLDTRENNHYNSNLTKIDKNTSDIDGLDAARINMQLYINSVSTKTNSNTSRIEVLESNVSDHNNDLANLNSNMNTNNIILQTHTSQIQSLQQYDISNNLNINSLINRTTNNETDINLIKNTTIPNLSNKFLIKDDAINGDSFLGPLKVNTIDVLNTNDNLIIGENANMIYLGSSTNQDSKVINIGGVNDTVNILGSTNYIQTNNVQIEDKVITLNKGSVGNNTSANVSVNIRDNDVDDQGYIRVNENMDQLLVKLPQNDKVLKIGENVNDFYSLCTKLYTDLQDSNLQTQIASNLSTITEHSNQITNLNNQLLQNIPFSKIANYPNNNSTTLLDDSGNFVKVSNSHINDGSIQTKKLQGVDPAIVIDKFLNQNGQWMSIFNFSDTFSFQNEFTDDVNANNNQINNMADGMFANDACTVGQMQLYCNDRVITNSNLTDYSISLVKLNGMNGDGTSVLYNNGSTGKVNDNHINDGQINPLKLTGTSTGNDGLKYLNNKGEWVVVSSGSSFDNKFTATVDAQNNRIINLPNPVDIGDATTKYYVDTKYLNSIETTSVIGANGPEKTFNIYDNVNMNSKNIRNIGYPVNQTDAATKDYVDYKTTSITFTTSSTSTVATPYTNLNIRSFSLALIPVNISYWDPSSYNFVIILSNRASSWSDMRYNIKYYGSGSYFYNMELRDTVGTNDIASLISVYILYGVLYLRCSSSTRAIALDQI